MWKNRIRPCELLSAEEVNASSKAPDAQAASESKVRMRPTILGRVNSVLHAAGLRNYRTGFYRPRISTTENYDRWNRLGDRTADVVAAERWKQVLAEYPDPGVDEQLKELTARRKQEIGND